MPDAAVWGAVAAAVAAFIALLRWVASISSRLTLAGSSAATAHAAAVGAKEKAEEAQTKATDAATRAVMAENVALRAVGKVELLASELKDLQVSHAASIARIETKTDGVADNLESAETRIVRSIDDLCKRIGDLTERLDDVLLERSEKPRRA